MIVGAPAIVAGDDTDLVFYDPNAVVVNVTEADLNHLLLDAFHEAGGPRFAGSRDDVSEYVTGLHYAAEFSEPYIDLSGGDGAARVSFALEHAELHIDKVERKIAGRRVRCENLGAELLPGNSLDVTLDLRLYLEDRDLRVDPLAAVVSEARKAFHLIKPSRCRKNLVPTFLLWWIGKPHLRKQFDNLDDLLLETARRSAAELEQDEDGFLNKRVRIGEKELQIYPRLMDTDHDSIWVTAVGLRNVDDHDDATALPPPLRPSPTQSYLAISEELANAVLGLAYQDWSRPTSRPQGSAAKLFRSDAVMTLVPGLRGIEDRSGLTWGVRLGAAPRIEFLVDRSAVAGEMQASMPPLRSSSRPLVLLHLSDIVLQIARGGGDDDEIGRFVIERGTIAAVPYATPLGGISLDVVRNEWQVSSSGLEFNEPLLAGTIQELVFGELFETQYEPLARGALTVGTTRFEPTRIDVVEGYLLIDFGRHVAERPAPTRTDTPLASR